MSCAISPTRMGRKSAYVLRRMMRHDVLQRVDGEAMPDDRRFLVCRVGAPSSRVNLPQRQGTALRTERIELRRNAVRCLGMVKDGTTKVRTEVEGKW